jgi:hypothetical protein
MIKNLEKFLLRKLKENRNKPLSSNLLTEEFFGKPTEDRDSPRYWKEKFDFFTNKLRVSRAFRSIREKTGLHIYNVDGNGFKVIENKEDFEKLSERYYRRSLIYKQISRRLNSDKNNDEYKAKVKAFYGKELSFNDFNNFAKSQLKKKMKR